MVNGGSATVEAIRAEKDTHRITVRLHSDDKAIDGTRLSWLVQPGGATKTPGFGHAYATTVHRSQGQTMRDVYHLANASASNSAVLVAFTRIKTNDQGTYHLAGDADSINALKTYAIGRLDVQRNALDLLAEAEAAKEAEAIAKEEGTQGVELLDFGDARYQNEDTGRLSYFVKIKGSDGKERTLWGVGLRNAIRECGAQKGDRITATVSGFADVVVDGKPATRNAWEVAVVSRAQTAEIAVPVAAVERAASTPARSADRGEGLGLGM